MTDVRIEYVSSGNEHTDQKWITLRGSVPGTPVFKTRTVNTAARVSGVTTLEAEKARLVADVEEYHARWLAVQAALATLGSQ